MKNKYTLIIPLFIISAVYIKINPQVFGNQTNSYYEGNSGNTNSFSENTNTEFTTIFKTNLRSYGALSASIIDRLPSGTYVEHLGEYSNQKFHTTIENKEYFEHFVKVRVKNTGTVGWLYRACISPVSIDSDYIGKDYYVAVSKLNMRGGPSRNYPVIMELKYKQHLVHHGQISEHREEIYINHRMTYEHWYHVTTDRGEQGWVYGGGIYSDSHHHQQSSSNHQQSHSNHQEQHGAEKFHREGFIFNKEIGGYVPIKDHANQNSTTHHLTRNHIDIQFMDGLKYRKPKVIPLINRLDDFSGMVKLYLCVRKDGKVASVKFTPRGSSSPSVEVIEHCKNATLNLSFGENDDYQCGHVTYNFLPIANDN